MASIVYALIFSTALCCKVLSADAWATNWTTDHITATEAPFTSDTCMTKWLKLAVANSNESTSFTAQTSESILAGFHQLPGVSSITDLGPSLVAASMGGNQQAAQYLMRCTGPSSSTQGCAVHSPCLKGGKCVFQPSPDTTSNFVCRCREGHTGRFCEIDLSGCTENVCGQGATCKPSHRGFVCLCPPLRTGRHCETTWFSPERLNSAVSSLDDLSSNQRRLQTSLKELMTDTAGHFRHIRKKIADKANASLEGSVSSLQSSFGAEKSKTQTVLSMMVQGLSNFATSMSGIMFHGYSNLYGFDPLKKTRHITVTQDGRTAWISGSQVGSAWGKVGYTTGIHRWFLSADLLGVHTGIGVVTLPNQGAFPDPGYDTGYVWFSNRDNGGLGAPQTRSTARMSTWRNHDTLTLTMDCDHQLLTIRLHRTNEEKTMTMKLQSQKIYLYLHLHYGSQVRILKYKEL